jgi:hypothetical protein
MKPQPCACTRDAPCLLHFAQDTDDDQQAWRDHLGLNQRYGHARDVPDRKRQRRGRF